MLKSSSLNKYEIFQVELRKDFEECQNLTNEIFNKELSRAAHGIISERQVILACRDKSLNIIIGCIVFEPATQTISIQNVSKALKLDKMTKNLLNHTLVLDLTAVKYEYRNKGIPSLLLMKLSEKLLPDGNVYFIVASCEPSLLKFHLRIGCSIFGEKYPSIYGGYQIPIIFNLYDKNMVNNKKTLIQLSHEGHNYKPKSMKDYLSMRDEIEKIKKII